MPRGHIERALSFCNIVHPVAQPAVAQSVLPHIEALTSTAKEILFGHDKIFNLDFAVRSTQAFTQGCMPVHGVYIS